PAARVSFRGAAGVPGRGRAPGGSSVGSVSRRRPPYWIRAVGPPTKRRTAAPEFIAPAPRSPRAPRVLRRAAPAALGSRTRSRARTPAPGISARSTSARCEPAAPQAALTPLGENPQPEPRERDHHRKHPVLRPGPP